jgi:hypothetical protein
MSQDWRASAHAARARRARMSGLSNYRRASRGGLRLAGAGQRDRARCFGPIDQVQFNRLLLSGLADRGC